jgi:integrase/recombinase XerD
MTALAPILQAFFTDRLMTQRGASPHTIASYRDTFTLLLGYLHQQTGKLPAQLDLADLDAPAIGAFLLQLETARGNSAATRNARLAAIRSLFRYASLRSPEHAALISRVLQIQPKRTATTIVSYLTRGELDALLAAPDRAAWHGRRDHALLVFAAQTGLRVSELTGLAIGDVHLGTGPHAYCRGKGRKDRATPLTPHTVGVLGPWITEQRAGTAGPLFATRAGTPLSRDAVEHLVTRHAATAARTCQPWKPRKSRRTRCGTPRR